MNKQTYSILFCALLASTFLHEIKARSEIKPHAKHHVLERAESPIDGQCEYVCNHPGLNVTLDLVVIANVTTGVIAVVNTTAHVALILDVNARIFGLFNGNEGYAIVIGLNAGTGIYVTLKESALVWSATKLTISAFLATFVTLKVFLQITAGVHFTLSNISIAVYTAINNILIHLFVGLKVELTANIKLGLEIILKICTQLFLYLNGNLKALVQAIGGLVIRLKGDLASFFNIIVALTVVVGRITGGLSGLIAVGVRLNFETIFSSYSGLEAFINLLLQIGAKVDLSLLLGGILNSVEDLFSLIALFGGNVSYGINGVFTVVYNIIAYIKGHLSLEALIHVILKFGVSNSSSDEISISVILGGFLEVLRIQDSLFKNSAALSVFAGIVNDLINEKLVVDGVNISAIIKVLVASMSKGPTYAIRLIVIIILKLTSIVKSSVAIPTVALTLIGELNSTAGAQLLTLSGINLDIDLTANESPLVQSLRNVNILYLITTSLNFYVFLSGLRGIGKIIEAIATAVSTESGGTLELKALLNSSSALTIVAYIKALISLSLGINLGVSSAITAFIKGLFKSFGNFAVDFSFNSSITSNITGGGGTSGASTEYYTVTEIYNVTGGSGGWGGFSLSFG